mmetsp:Transcript_43366/g.52544  ORF Transcript_43366/g.52544 Transcript_43366/m.52544 type:complete len:85 (+) Transcript_43366:3-257(+)
MPASSKGLPICASWALMMALVNATSLSDKVAGASVAAEKTEDGVKRREVMPALGAKADAPLRDAASATKTTCFENFMVFALLML